MSSQREMDTPQQHEWSERKTVHSPVLSAEEARQASTGTNLRYVLAFGLAAIVIAFLAIWLFYFG